MPTILELDGFRFYFFSNEGSEPVHVHVSKGDGIAKLWLDPLTVAYSKRLNPAELRRVREITFANRVMFVRRWNEYFAR